MRRAVIVFLATLLLVAAVYRRVPINFFRAESGWYLFMSHADAETQRQCVRNFFTTSYGGHYTPLMFLAEFATAKLAGASQSFWRWRQLVALALIGTTLFGIVAMIGGVYQLRANQRLAIAAVLTAVSIYQPQMVDLMSWPFMICQLVWIAFFLSALYSVVRLAVSPEKTRWAWIAALTAYASMHALGLGLTTVAATVAVLLVFLAIALRDANSPFHAHRRGIAAALITLMVLGAVHGWAMIHLLPGAKSFAHSQPHMFASMAKLLFGFAGNLALAAMRTFVATSYSEPNEFSLAYCWPYGVLVIAALVASFYVLLRRTLSAGPPMLLTFTLHAFSIIGFVTLVAMIASRQLGQASLQDAAGNLIYFTFVPRYVVPLHFLLIPSAIHIFILLSRRAPRVMTVVCYAITLAALIAQIEFQATAYRYIAPRSHISHAGAWRLIVATARECRAAKLPLPNVPLVALTQEFSDWDARMFAPLLRRELKLRTEDTVEIIPWSEYGPVRERYSSVPSLRLLEEKLQLTER